MFVNQLPSPAKRQNRLLLITKKYYPLAGGSQQHEYPKQTDTVCLEAWCLVQLPCQIQAHRSSYSRSESQRRGGGLLSARCNVVIPISSSLLDSKTDREAEGERRIGCSLSLSQRVIRANSTACDEHFPTCGAIADGRVGGCEFLNMHSSMSGLQTRRGWKEGKTHPLLSSCCVVARDVMIKLDFFHQVFSSTTSVFSSAGQT